MYDVNETNVLLHDVTLELRVVCLTSLLGTEGVVSDVPPSLEPSDFVLEVNVVPVTSFRKAEEATSELLELRSITKATVVELKSSSISLPRLYNWTW